MKSLAELDKLRDTLQQEMKARQGEHDVSIAVSMGTCGIAAGAREVVKVLLNELKEQELSYVALTQTSCVGLCRQEPLLEVKMGDEKVIYVNVDQEKAKEIVRRHLMRGEIIKEWTAS
ncbi:MAG: (2Fe-2S) ferredoxin domain-containing protein [Firmicutes bacterium]|nr:(2Fe-2S) ferredoxin domain-containing protein [Bacillota bacterium]